MKANRKGVASVFAGDFRVSVKTETGRVHCTCPDFQERCAEHRPTVFQGPKCMHVASRLAEFRKACQERIEDKKRSDIFELRGGQIQFREGFVWRGGGRQ